MQLLKSIIVSFLNPLLEEIKVDTILTSDNPGWRLIQRQFLQRDCCYAFLCLSKLESCSSKDAVWSFAAGCMGESLGPPQARLGRSKRCKVSLSDGSHYKIHGPLNAIKCLVTRKCQLLSLSSFLLRLFVRFCLSFSTRL